MLTIRHADDRGVANLGWLTSRHTFSFAEYYEAKFMGIGPLRVINEDKVQPGQGFGTHGHQDMEIMSYVLDGALEHKDDLGTGSIIRPGDIQRMTAGTGVRHSEFNHSDVDLVHFLQIWVLPETNGLRPSYEQKTFSNTDKQGKLCLVGSRDGRYGSVTIHQDISLYASLLTENDEVVHALAAGRKIWIQIASGSVRINGEQLNSGDGAAVTEPGFINMVATSAAEILLFDMAG